MMPITPQTRMFAWALLGASACYVSLWGLTISSASVVKSQKDHLEFGLLGTAITLGIAFSAQRPWRAVALIFGLFYAWCLTTGWKIEQSNFDATAEATLTGLSLSFGTVIGLLEILLITAFLKLTTPSQPEDEVPMRFDSGE